MNPNEMRAGVLGALAAIAPEADLALLSGSEDVRDALDLDSMDVLRFATALHDRFGVEVPESDYAQITSLDGCLTYLQRHAAAEGSTGS